jgi:hypothetical protein
MPVAAVSSVFQTKPIPIEPQTFTTNNSNPMFYITDITHYLDESGNFPARMPKPARELAAFLTMVIEAATSQFPEEPFVDTDLRCFIKGCHGNISTFLPLMNEVIKWECSDCDCAGTISNWQDSRWDFTGEL